MAVAADEWRDRGAVVLPAGHYIGPLPPGARVQVSVPPGMGPAPTLQQLQQSPPPQIADDDDRDDELPTTLPPNSSRPAAYPPPHPLGGFASSGFVSRTSVASAPLRSVSSADAALLRARHATEARLQQQRLINERYRAEAASGADAARRFVQARLLQAQLLETQLPPAPLPPAQLPPPPAPVPATTAAAPARGSVATNSHSSPPAYLPPAELPCGPAGEALVDWVPAPSTGASSALDIDAAAAEAHALLAETQAAGPGASVPSAPPEVDGQLADLLDTAGRLQLSIARTAADLRTELDGLCDRVATPTPALLASGRFSSGSASPAVAAQLRLRQQRAGSGDPVPDPGAGVRSASTTPPPTPPAPYFGDPDIAGRGGAGPPPPAAPPDPLPTWPAESSGTQPPTPAAAGALPSWLPLAEAAAAAAAAAAAGAADSRSGSLPSTIALPGAPPAPAERPPASVVSTVAPPRRWAAPTDYYRVDPAACNECG